MKIVVNKVEANATEVDKPLSLYGGVIPETSSDRLDDIAGWSGKSKRDSQRTSSQLKAEITLNSIDMRNIRLRKASGF